MFSIICAYNDEVLFNKNLKSSLSKQSFPYELIAIDNSQKNFASAAEALNWGGHKANGEYLVFVHQDVMLCGDSWLKNAKDILDSMPRLGIAGCAGVDKKGKELGFIQDRNCLWGWPINKSTIVQTLDECLIIIPRKVFTELKFDERIDGWHVYALDYCLTVKRMGYEAYVIPGFIHHNSPTVNLGGLTNGHRYIWKKHRRHFRKIFTTCGNLNYVFSKIRSFLFMVEKFLRIELLYASRKPQINTLFNELLRGSNKILSIYPVDAVAEKYYEDRLCIKTRALPHSPMTDNRDIHNYLISNLKHALSNLKGSIFDSAILPLDAFKTLSTEDSVTVIQEIQKLVKGNILIYRVTDIARVIDGLQELERVLYLSGFSKHTHDIYHPLSNTKKYFYSLQN